MRKKIEKISLFRKVFSIFWKNVKGGLDIFKKKWYTITMKVYEYKENFKLKYCDVDFKDECKVSTALALMEEVACQSADELGFGYSYTKSLNHAFMVSNICLQFEKPIRLGEVVTLKTWPLQPTKVIFGREYLIELEEETLARGSSRWCLIDMQTGKIAPSKIICNQDYSTYNTNRVFEEVQWKIPTFLPEEGELCFTIKIANSEYDHNMHVNNTRYADYCINCFSIAELSRVFLKSFSISYIKQAKEGDVLCFYRKKTEDGRYAVQGMKDGKELIVQAWIGFEENHAKK